MNERIRELVRQAGLDDADFPIENWDNVPLAKFAELIVKECVAICQDVDGEEDAMALCGRQDCAVEIREHFGVES
jgi:hypothetical protein